MPEVKSHPCFLTPRKLNPGLPLFVFLPGMDGTGQLLRAQTAGLELAFDIRCLVIPADDLTSWDVLTDKVVKLVEAELAKDAQRSVYLCGESFGGCLAMKVVVKAPHLFDRIILANPASAFKHQLCLNWGSQFLPYVPEFLYHVGAVGLMPLFAALERIAPSDRRALLDAMQSVPPKTVNWRLSLLKEFYLSEEQLRSITQPVLLLAGAMDRVLPSITEAKHLSSYLPNVRTVVLPHSGHACLLETDVNLYSILKEQNFLEHRDKTLLSVSA